MTQPIDRELGPVDQLLLLAGERGRDRHEREREQQRENAAHQNLPRAVSHPPPQPSPARGREGVTPWKRHGFTPSPLVGEGRGGGCGRGKHDRHQNSMPFWALTPARNGCFTRPMSVTRSASSISSGLALRPVTTTCRSRRLVRSASSTSSSAR